MNDKELLELAAKAAGMEGRYDEVTDVFYTDDAMNGREWWNPLTDDGDALRLAVKLNLCIASSEYVTNQHCFVEIGETEDPYAANRRAIVRAAAEIGKGMT